MVSGRDSKVADDYFTCAKNCTPKHCIAVHHSGNKCDEFELYQKPSLVPKVNTEAKSSE